MAKHFHLLSLFVTRKTMMASRRYARSESCAVW